MLICILRKGLWIAYPGKRHGRGETLHLGRSSLERGEPGNIKPILFSFFFQSIEYSFSETSLKNTACIYQPCVSAFSTPPTLPKPLIHTTMGRDRGNNDEEAVPLMMSSVERITEKLWGEKPARIQWARMGWSMLPWVITAPLGKTERKLPKVTSTSYLNGLRGIACVIVYNYHVTILWNPNLKGTVGLVPFVNIVLAGHGATMVFFVLSGFVLSYSPLSKISSPDGPSEAVDSKLLTSLWSSTIRRGFRLFMPLAALAFLLTLVTFFTHVYGPSPKLPWAQVEPHTFSTFFNHLGSYAHLVSFLMDPFTWDTIQPDTLEHAWTLPFEYRGSLVVFLLCIACAHLTPRCRKLCLIIFGFWALYWIRWDVFCFTAGMFLAELRFRPLFSFSSSSNSQPEPLPHSATDDLTPCRPWTRIAK